MPVERGYEARIMPREAAPLPLARPEQYGAGIGGELAQAGEDMHARQLRSYQLDRREAADAQAADFDHRFALHRQNMDGVQQQLRANAGPGGAGHAEAVLKANAAAKDALFSGISDDRVRRAAAGQWDEYQTRLGAAEGNFEEGQRIAKEITDRGRTTDVGANRIRQGVDPDAYRAELALAHQAIDLAQDIPDTLRAKLHDQVDVKYAIAFVGHLQDTNPRAAQALLDAGAFNHLPSEVVDQLRNGTAVEIRRADAGVAEEARAREAAAKEEIATLRVRSGRGEDVSAELPRAIASAEAMGDSSLAEELRGIGEDNDFAKIYSGVPPLRRQARIAELRAQTNPTAKEQRELHWHEQKGPSLDAKFNNDPVGWAIDNAPPSGKPPAITQGLAARLPWQRAASQRYGIVMPFLSGNEVAALRTHALASPAGQLEVANTLGALPVRDGINAARQISPGDGMLAQMVTISPEDRGRVQMGAEVRKGNRALVDGAAGNEALALFNGTVGRALRLLPPDERQATLEAAKNLYADWAGRTGHLDYDQASFEPWIGRALGARLTEWRGEKVLLPPGYDATHFSRSISAYKPDAGSRNAPVRANGAAMSGDELRRYIPRRRPDGNYQFETETGRETVLTRSGTIFVLGLPERGR